MIKSFFPEKTFVLIGFVLKEIRNKDIHFVVYPKCIDAKKKSQNLAHEDAI